MEHKCLLLQDVEVLCKALEQYPGLPHHIDLSYNPLSDAIVTHLLPLLQVRVLNQADWVSANFIGVLSRVYRVRVVCCHPWT